MPRFRNPNAVQAPRFATLSLDDAVEADLIRRRKAQQWLQQPTPNPSPSPESLRSPLSLPVSSSGCFARSALSEAQPTPNPKSEVLLLSPPSPASSTVSIPPKRNHSARRAAGAEFQPPRPKNAFILFRSYAVAHGLVKTTQQNEISKIVGALWRNADKDTKETFQARAIEEKRQHAILYPDYKYSPGTRKTDSAPAAGTTTARLRHDAKSTSTKKRRVEDEDEAEWDEFASMRSRNTSLPAKRSKLSSTIPTPETSPEPLLSPESERKVSEGDNFSTLCHIEEYIDIPEFQPEAAVEGEDLNGYGYVDNTMFAGFFECHKKLLESCAILSTDSGFQPSLTYPASHQGSAALPSSRIPGLDMASFASFAPSISYEDRTHVPAQPQLTFSYSHMASQLIDPQPSGGTFSLQISDEVLFKDVLDDALMPKDELDASIRPISPLWMIDADGLAQEMGNVIF